MHAILAVALSFVLVTAAPALLLEPATRTVDESLVIMVEAEGDYDECCIRLNTGAEIVDLPLEEYLVGVLFAEMPLSFHKEALKAQAVAARTFTAHRLDKPKHEMFDVCGDSHCCQAWCDYKSGEISDLDLYNTQTAVRETAGEVMTYGGDLIEAVYFSCSGGRTEAAVSVWGSEIPYLQSVISVNEIEAPRNASQVRVSIDEFSDTLVALNSDVVLDGKAENWIEEEERTSGGGISRIKLGGEWFSGTELRKAFGLNSTLFTLSMVDKEIVFDVSGYGHRVGMSQYGADAMADLGADYQRILQHYYTGIELEKRSSLK